MTVTTRVIYNILNMQMKKLAEHIDTHVREYRYSPIFWCIGKTFIFLKTKATGKNLTTKTSFCFRFNNYSSFKYTKN